jgi:hypothetical protein
MGVTTVTDQLTYSEAELLASHDYAAPLVAGGRTCHGGFDADGTYRSPRTLHRTDAIAAWQARHRADTGTDLLDIGLETFPPNYPNVAQSKLLLRHGVTDPIVAALTRIGTVEGFGSMLRASIVPDLQASFEESIAGTATGHLGSGLIEAHARDEAGFGAEAGHNEMWFTARDIAFEHPPTEDQTEVMLVRLGVKKPGAAVDLAALRAAALANRTLPGDISFEVEALLERMVSLLLIEISAFHIFRWAEELLGDDELVAGDGEAARLVSRIRADETPHVEYLKTSLSEMRERTFVGEGGRRHAGREVLAAIWEPAVANQRGARRQELLDINRREVERAIRETPGTDGLLEEFDALGTAHRDADGVWHEELAA